MLRSPVQATRCCALYERGNRRRKQPACSRLQTQLLVTDIHTVVISGLAGRLHCSPSHVAEIQLRPWDQTNGSRRSSSSPRQIRLDTRCCSSRAVSLVNASSGFIAGDRISNSVQPQKDFCSSQHWIDTGTSPAVGMHIYCFVELLWHIFFLGEAH